MPSGHALGEWGEDCARRFLAACGYHCLGRRFRRAGGEIDLVLARGRTLVFVEVKTRGPRCPIPPESWVTGVKLRRMRRMARIWLAENPGGDWRCLRFDVVAVAFGGDGRGAEIRHLKGAD